MYNNRTVGQKVFETVKLLQKYLSRRENDLEVAESAKADTTKISKDIADLMTAIEWLGSITLAEINQL